MEEYIVFDRITKVFPGQRALDDVSFSVAKGEIHAIIGENGAGKSTLLNILHGVFPATSGEIRIDGNTTPVKFSSTADAMDQGIVKVHQEIISIPDMTVAENLFMGKEPSRLGFIRYAQMNESAQRVLDRLRCNISATARMGDLSTGQKQMVAIAKALEMDAKIISFDEPTSSLSDAEVRILFDIIRELKEKGITILYISHKMSEIFSLCDRATVLRDGKFIDTLRLADTTRDAIIHAMVGRDISLFAQRLIESQCDEDTITLQVHSLSGEMFHDCSFSLHKGEILGFFGLVGAGRTELMRAIYGADARKSGTVHLHGKQVHLKSPADAIHAGIALISENRKEEGILPNFANKDNIAVASLDQFRAGAMINDRKKKENAIEKGALVGLRPNDPEFMTVSLSGGNAQKVILARWMSTDASIMIFDEPTKGIDIGAKAEIYQLMEKMVENGVSIIMISSELTEIMGMADRILVMREGSITADIPRSEFAENTILNFAVEGE